MSIISDAFQRFKLLDLLDTSQEGTRQLESCSDFYSRALNSFDSQIIQCIHKIFLDTKDIESRFSVFQILKNLQGRNSLKQELLIYQSQLLQIVKLETKKVIESYKETQSNKGVGVLIKRFGVQRNSFLLNQSQIRKDQLDQLRQKMIAQLGQYCLENPLAKEVI